MRNIVTAVLTLGLVVACGGESREAKDTVYAPQLRALEKARAVENTLKEGEQKTRAAVEQGTR